MPFETPSGQPSPILAPAEGDEPFISLRPETHRPKKRAAKAARPTLAPAKPKLASDPVEMVAIRHPLLYWNGQRWVLNLTRPSMTGLGVSLAFHGLLLLCMGVWYFSPHQDGAKVLDSRLAGSPFGDDSGQSLTGGLGMDDPLSLPEGPIAEAETQPITSLSVADLNLEPLLSKRATEGGPATSSSGLNLGGPGAGSGDGFGVAKFGMGGENINGIAVKVGDPQFTLIWDSKGDLDLHVIEPGGSEIFWEDRFGKQGGELDVDDMDGFGPENVNYSGGSGKGPPGAYKWFVRYYGAYNGISLPTRWKVRVKHDGIVNTYKGAFRRIGEQSKTYTLTLDRPTTDADADSTNKVNSAEFP
ncbi:MAG: hypothetical protein ABI353_01160 [Isosphaeraceae bacterium]